MNAEPAAQLQLLDLQSLDARLDLLAHQRRSLPVHQRIAELEARLAALRDRVVAGETEVSDLDRAQLKAEADVEQVRVRIRRDDELMQSGRIVSSKELENLQHETDSLARRQAALEDAELEVMEKLEDARGALATLVAARAVVDSELTAALVSREESFAEMDGDGTWVNQERARLAPQIPGDLMKLYEKLRADNGGVGAAALHQGRCQGCRMQLTPTDISRIRVAAPDEVLRCEECRRILIRTPESGL